MTEEEVQEVLKQRRLAWKPKERKYKKGVLRLFSELAASPMKGLIWNTISKILSFLI